MVNKSKSENEQKSKKKRNEVPGRTNYWGNFNIRNSNFFTWAYYTKGGHPT